MPRTASAPVWLVPAGLLLLSFVPIAGGAVRFTQVASGADITAANARFFASPLPVMLHIVSVTVYALLGAFQFSAVRRRWPAWHRAAGRVLIPFGLVAALSGLWMTLFYPWPNGDGVLLYDFRLLFGSFMLLSLVLGVVAIRQRDFVRHGQWMRRGYAIGLGAGTQAFTLMIWEVTFGKPELLPRALLMGAGWGINLAVAEAIIRKRPTAVAAATPVVPARLP